MSKKSKRSAASRARIIQRLQEVAGVDEDRAENLYDTQVDPQLRIHEMRAQGHDVDVGLVRVDRDAPGHTVTCEGCGRTAKLPRPVPAGQVGMCPQCVRLRGLGSR